MSDPANDWNEFAPVGKVRVTKVDVPSPQLKWESLRDLLTEIVQIHADPTDPGYNECDVDKCQWCEQAIYWMGQLGGGSDIHDLAVAKATPEEMAQLLRDMTAECSRYREAFYAAKAFIESHAADPDLTSEMVERYAEYQEAAKEI